MGSLIFSICIITHLTVFTVEVRGQSVSICCGQAYLSLASCGVLLQSSEVSDVPSFLRLGGKDSTKFKRLTESRMASSQQNLSPKLSPPPSLRTEESSSTGNWRLNKGRQHAVIRLYVFVPYVVCVHGCEYTCFMCAHASCDVAVHATC